MEVPTPSEEVPILGPNEIKDLLDRFSPFEFEKKTSFFKEILLYYLYLYLRNKGVVLVEIDFAQFRGDDRIITRLTKSYFEKLHLWFTLNYPKNDTENYKTILNAIQRVISSSQTMFDSNDGTSPPFEFTPETILILLFILKYSFPGVGHRGDVAKVVNGLALKFKLKYEVDFQDLIADTMKTINSFAIALVDSLVNIRRGKMIQERDEYESHLKRETRQKKKNALKKSIGKLSDQNIEEECKKLRDDLAENLKSSIQQFIKLFKLDEFMIPNPEG